MRICFKDTMNCTIFSVKVYGRIDVFDRVSVRTIVTARQSNCRGHDCLEHFCGKSGVLQQEEKTVIRAGEAAGEREGETKWK